MNTTTNRQLNRSTCMLGRGLKSIAFWEYRQATERNTKPDVLSDCYEGELIGPVFVSLRYGESSKPA